jgi:hypothetical protein
MNDNSFFVHLDPPPVGAGFSLRLKFPREKAT